MGNMKKSRKGWTERWMKGFLTLCILAGLCGVSVNADQDTQQSPLTAVGVSGNDSEHGAVSSGDAESGKGKYDILGTSIPIKLKTAPVISIQVPDNLDFVIDPWNLSGKGQIYSEHFTIRNCGNMICTVVLQNIVCIGDNGVVVVKDVEQIYAQDAAGAYLEIVFENGETLALSAEDKEYTAILEPGGELVFWFAGAVNERASEGWENKELSVGLKYFSITGMAENGV